MLLAHLQFEPVLQLLLELVIHEMLFHLSHKPPLQILIERFAWLEHNEIPLIVQFILELFAQFF